MAKVLIFYRNARRSIYTTVYCELRLNPPPRRGPANYVLAGTILFTGAPCWPERAAIKWPWGAMSRGLGAAPEEDKAIGTRTDRHEGASIRLGTDR